MTLPHPFSGPPPAEVQLPDAPLVRVLAQITFPQILAVANKETVAPFQERIRHAYPLTKSDLLHTIQLSGDNQPTVERTQIWRFEDKTHHWKVALAPHFLALETECYTTRTEFLDRITNLITALQETLDPQITQRVGLRYIDRLRGEAFNNVTALIKPEFLGPNTSGYEHAAIHMLTQALFHTEEGAMLNARWGKLPANATIDPNALEPLPEPSWVMDFDLFTEVEGNFAAADLSPLLATFAQRIYAVFRFMITDQFLEFYGGKL
jgi:uncharacterized protein (TIGR04255 family)